MKATLSKNAEGLPSASGWATAFKVPCSDLRRSLMRLPDLFISYQEYSDNANAKAPLLRDALKRPTGIEPASRAWEARIITII